MTSLADMEMLFAGIDLGAITTSMTINGPASMIFAMYLALAEQRGTDWKTLSGTIQNDILKEFIAQKEFIYPPEPSMRLVTDVFAFCTEHVPRWNTISVSGYHIREAGATALSTCSTASTRAWTWTRSPHASPSSSTRTATSLRRLPSSAPRAGSGRG